MLHPARRLLHDWGDIKHEYREEPKVGENFEKLAPSKATTSAGHRTGQRCAQILLAGV